MESMDKNLQIELDTIEKTLLEQIERDQANARAKMERAQEPVRMRVLNLKDKLEKKGFYGTNSKAPVRSSYRDHIKARFEWLVLLNRVFC